MSGEPLGTIEPQPRLSGELERIATVARGRLADTLEALDRRRHVSWQLHHHARGLALLGGTLFAAFVGVTGWMIVRSATRRRRRHHDGLLALPRRLRDELRARREPQPSMWKEIGRKLVIGLAATVGIRLVRAAIAA